MEVHDYFIDKLDALVAFSCDEVKRACFFFIAHLLQNHYLSDMRDKLILHIKKLLSPHSTIQRRKNFILFCQESVKVNTPDKDGFFDKHFFPMYLDMAKKETNEQVMLTFVRSLSDIRTSLIQTKNIVSFLMFGQMISHLRAKYSFSGKNGEIQNVFNERTASFRDNKNGGAIAEMGDVDTDEIDQKRKDLLQRLQDREEYENAQRHKLHRKMRKS